MMIVRRSLFSRHTPDDLEEYQMDKLSDKQLKKLSEGEIDAIIDEDCGIANENTDKYIKKKIPKYLLVGTGTGAVAGRLLSPKGRKGIGGVIGGVGGSLFGLMGAASRGTAKAYEEGHDWRKVTKREAKRADKSRGGKSNHYEKARKRELDEREMELRKEMNDLTRERNNIERNRYYRDYYY